MYQMNKDNIILLPLLIIMFHCTLSILYNLAVFGMAKNGLLLLMLL